VIRLQTPALAITCREFGYGVALPLIRRGSRACGGKAQHSPACGRSGAERTSEGRLQLASIRQGLGLRGHRGRQGSVELGGLPACSAALFLECVVAPSYSAEALALAGAQARPICGAGTVLCPCLAGPRGGQLSQGGAPWGEAGAGAATDHPPCRGQLGTVVSRPARQRDGATLRLLAHLCGTMCASNAIRRWLGAGNQA